MGESWQEAGIRPRGQETQDETSPLADELLKMTPDEMLWHIRDLRQKMEDVPLVGQYLTNLLADFSSSIERDEVPGISESEINAVMHFGSSDRNVLELVNILKAVSPQVRASIGKLAQDLVEQEKAQRVAETLGAFHLVDVDNDNLLTRQEIELALQNQSLSADMRQSLYYLYQRLDKVAQFSSDNDVPGDGVSRADLIESRKEVNFDSLKQVGAFRDLILRARRAAEIEHRLYGDRWAPMDSVRPEACEQGVIGDCWLIAAIASMANTQKGREAIYKMISPDPAHGGAYLVQFPGRDPVSVPGPTRSELARYAGGTEHGRWAAVLAKGVAALVQRDVGLRIGSEPVQELLGGGGRLEHAMHILTGGNFTAVGCDSDEFMTSLEEASRAGDPISAGSRPEQPDGCGIYPSHAYTVLAYDPQRRMVTLRNPWGKGEPGDPGAAADGADDGRFSITLEAFLNLFHHIVVPVK